MSIFLGVFLGVLTAMVASQLIGWIVFYIWWTEPFKRTPKEPKPQATYRSADNA